MVVQSTTLALSPEANIFRYLQEINKFPMLTSEDGLMQALEGLKERERASLVERHLRETPATPEILSQQYRVSRERIRQIEVRALQKPQKSIRNAACEQRLTQ